MATKGKSSQNGQVAKATGSVADVDTVTAGVDSDMVTKLTIAESALAVANAEIERLTDELNTANAVHKKEIEESLAYVEELQNQVSVKSKLVSNGLPTIAVGDKTYQIRYSKINFEGEVWTAEDIAADADKAEALIAVESGMLKEV